MQQLTFKTKLKLKLQWQKFFCLLFFSLLSSQVFSQVATDACASANALTIGTTANSTNAGATNSASDPVPSCGFTISNTVWYKFTPAASGNVTFTLTHVAIRWEGIAVYSGTCGTLTELACGEATTNTGNTTITASCLTGGTTYYVMIWDDPGNGTAVAGTFALASSFTAYTTPANDACASATNLGTILTSTTVTGNNSCATVDNDVSTCFSASNNVWYKFTTGIGVGYVASFTLTTPGTGSNLIYPAMAIYSGTCGSFSQLVCSNPFTTGGPVNMTASCLTPSTTYYVEIDDDFGTPGTFTLTTSLALGTAGPTNDNCSSATNMGTAFTNTTVTGNNTCAYVDNDVSNCFSASNNVWYKFTTGAGAGYVATFTLTTPGTGSNLTYPVLAAYSGTCGAFTQLACSNPFTSGGPVTATATCLTPNTTYYVEVDDDFGSPGTFSLTTHLAAGVSGSPANDNCNAATNLGTAPTTTTVAGNNTCASADNDVAGCFTANHNMWYKFTTGAGTGYVATFTVTAGTLTYPNIDVFSGSCATLTEMSGACDAPFTSGTITNSVTCLAPNTTYYIEVDNDPSSGTSGTFSLTLHLAAGTGVPTNDNCSAATNLGTAVTNTVVTGTTICASADNDVATCFTASQNVWYKFTTGAAFTTATFTLTTPGTLGTNLNYPVLDVFSGTCGSFTELVCNNPFTSAGPVTATATCLSPNTTYYVEVDDDFGGPGTYTLTVHTNTTAVGCSGSPAGGSISPLSQTVSCTPGSVAFSLSGEATGCGITYQWQTSPNGTTWTNVTGATNTTYTDPSISATTYVKCVVTCNNSTNSSSSIATIVTSASPGVNGVPTCSLAPTVTTGFGCGDNTTAPITDPGYWPSLSQFTCDGSIDNLLFQQFQTNSVGGTVNLIVSNIACISGEGVQVALFDPTSICTASGWGTALFCYDGSDLATYTLTMTSLLSNHTYYLVYDGYAGAECTWGTQLTGNVVLPIDLLSFTGQFNNSQVDLNWATAAETNNNYFTIERSADGYNFNELARVKGSGTTTTKHNYSITDYFPLGGISYYRLTQTDFNGNVNRQNIVPITNTKNDGMFKVAPNPTNAIVNVTYFCGASISGTLKLYNSSGEVVFTKDFNCTTGQNDAEIDLSSLPSGMYLITFIANDKLYHTKLIKQ